MKITFNGQDSLVLMNAKEYKRLSKRERTVVDVTSLSDSDIHTIKMTTMSDKHNHFNGEIDDL